MISFEAVRHELKNGVATIWLPIRRWPVVYMSFLRRDTQQPIWTLYHEAFREVDVMPGSMMIVTQMIVGDSAVQQRTDEGAIGSLSLEYGVAPVHMKQVLPEFGRPVELEGGQAYLVVVREGVNSELRRFLLEL